MLIAPADQVGEADWLHRALFGVAVPPPLAARYAVALACLDIPAGSGQQGTIERVVTARLDVEAVELALRRRGPHLLTRKLHALTFLAETTHGYHDRFVLERRSRTAAFATLISAGARSAYKWLKGRYLVWRHGLV
jgi:hypothetical protein